jgi:hypothetical protein
VFTYGFIPIHGRCIVALSDLLESVVIAARETGRNEEKL